MLSELAVGHSYQSGGDNPFQVETISGGLLGADYDIDQGRYPASRKFTRSELEPRACGRRSPSRGVDVHAGEYLRCMKASADGAG